MQPTTHEYHELLAMLKDQPMNADNAAIATLHYQYRHLTGFELTLDFYRERQWYEWMQRGNDVDGLKLVVAYLQKQIKKGERNRGSLKFHNLIGSPDHFEEDLAMARAEARKPKIDTARASVLAATGRVERHDKPPRTAAQILAGEQAFRQFKALKDTL